MITTPSPSAIDMIPARNWIAILAAYRQPSLGRSLWELFASLGPFALLWLAAGISTSISYWLTLFFSLAAAGFLIRLFMILHDCAHGSFFNSRRANDWTGRLLGVLTLTPFDLWKRSHLIHHATHGNLDKRGVGDILTLTVDEYKARSMLGRLAYRFYRHPAILFGLGPIFIFMVHHRLPIGFMRAGSKYWISAMATNVGIAALLISGIFAFGWQAFLITYLLIASVSAMIGVWLFYVQHQFETTVWDDTGNWQLHDAALYGSSYYKLPQPLQWMTANIGIHNVHHLYSRIPFYRLPEVLHDHPALARVGRVTLSSSLRTTRLKLWDPQNRRLVTFETGNAMSARYPHGGQLSK